MIHIKDMDAETLDILITDYNWDNGFRIPQMVIDNKNCELSTAMKTFYLGDGYSYLIRNSNDNSKWFQFIYCLYNRILEGDFLKGNLSYKIPLTKIQIYKLKKNTVPDILLTDI